MNRLLSALNHADLIEQPKPACLSEHSSRQPRHFPDQAAADGDEPSSEFHFDQKLLDRLADDLKFGAAVFDYRP